MAGDPVETIWVDVEDFCTYFEYNPRPSGIQRLAFEIMRALRRRVDGVGGGAVRFVRRGPGGEGALLEEVAWAGLAQLFSAPGDAPALMRPKGSTRLVRRRVAQAINRLPPDLRGPLFRAAVLQSQAARHAGEALITLRPWRRGLGRSLGRSLARSLGPGLGRAGDGVPAALATAGLPVKRGDTFLVLGAPWSVAGFPAWLGRLRERHGVRVTLLLYDLVPVRHPEWGTRAAVALFEAWLDATLPQCDRLFAISQHSAADAEAYARERGIVLTGPVQAIPVGTGFGDGDGAGAALGAALGHDNLPRPGSYVLFVSTLEPRKNHAFLVRVWRRLAEEVRTGARPPDWLPTLVFAGRVGWQVEDMMQQLENTAWLGGRVRLVRDPTDAEVGALYAGCLFTIFPSLFEGWGLPVTESLAHGKPCLASNATALPEAGGALCRYFDPENAHSAYRAIVALLDDPAGLVVWQAQVVREFRPTPWDATAAAVLGRVMAPVVAPGMAPGVVSA